MKKYIKTLVLFFICAFAITTSNIYMDSAIATPVATQVNKTVQQNNYVAPLTIVANPKAYLNKTVIIKARFDKFSTLGLDYKPAFKSSENYISFLVKRDDTTYDIPLAEMKLFLKRDLAEKHIDLKANDEISITGVVFSDALGDTWIDVSKLDVIKKAPNKDGVK